MIIREGFTLLAEYSLHFCERQQLPISLVFFDLDNFKSINDDYGHKEGDRALRRFAELLQQSCRHSDLYARLGGDEFALLLTNTSESSAISFVSKFQKILLQFNDQSSLPYQINVSCGVTSVDTTDTITLEKMLAAGDKKMYQAKMNKNNSLTG